MINIIPESVVIVRHDSHGSSATLRFNNAKYDRVFSGTNQTDIYTMIDRYVEYINKTEQK